jgi:hypothetical protein
MQVVLQTECWPPDSYKCASQVMLEFFRGPVNSAVLCFIPLNGILCSALSLCSTINMIAEQQLSLLRPNVIGPLWEDLTLMLIYTHTQFLYLLKSDNRISTQQLLYLVSCYKRATTNVWISPYFSFYPTSFCVQMRYG